jgi:hypothetical protein
MLALAVRRHLTYQGANNASDRPRAHGPARPDSSPARHDTGEQVRRQLTV